METESAKKVLLVGNHTLFSEALGYVLWRHLFGEAAPEGATHVATLEGVLAVRAEQEGPFGLAVVDLNPAGGDGLEVVRRIKASWPETPVAVLGAARDRPTALETGADEAMGEDASLAEVIDRLAGLVPDGFRSVAQGAANRATRHVAPGRFRGQDAARRFEEIPRRETMIHVLGSVRTGDLQKFVGVFSTAGAEARGRHGSRGADLFTVPAEEGRVMVLMRWTSEEDFGGFRNDPTVRETMASGGMMGPPEFTVLEKVGEFPR